MLRRHDVRFRRVLLAAVAAVLVAPGSAAAKSYTLPEADVAVTVSPDGSLLVEESISFDFVGDFEGAFREIPLREGESVDAIAVAEGGEAYRPGASAELGSSGAPGTFGVARLDDAVRIVWHYRASSERRTFLVRYRVRGLAIAYDDVVDVNLKVWGDEWEVGVGRLTASMQAPDGPVRRAWGHPVWVRGDVTLDGPRALLRAVDVPPRQFVELRALYPRDVFPSTAGMQVRPGAALPRIVAEEQADAAAYTRGQERIDDWVAHPLRSVGVLLLLGLGPALAILGLAWWVWGRERSTGYDREYEQEPPSDLEPALVPPLLRRSTEAGSNEFTATLFDLIRRGRYRSSPTTTERRSWGGLRSEHVADLELARGTDVPLAPFERTVTDVADAVVADGPWPLSRFRERITEDRTENSKRFAAFKSEVTAAIKARRWYSSGGLKLLVPAAALLLVGGALALWLGIERFRPVAPGWGSVVTIALGACALANGALLTGVGLVRRSLWRRRRPDAQREAERWDAFRRYLVDFPRLHEAPPASLELWERYLVVGIALGIAERVLQGAQLHMPAELHDASSIYWITPTGDLGSGPSALAISDLSSGFGSALAPPSSGSGGGGGGFSGGGGGGAW